ncbi:DnaC-like helicase loader [Bacillus phage G]|uniref:Gp225 n=1 Tax=Bacillus phage G TaxID=2884420 RepID=G3M9W6_9CAUD|nr:DnaC-like helicase loader [Bacillus phage G]AEO93484.1 gp225 [Bacillus phage G]
MIFTREEQQAEVKKWQNRLVRNCPKCKGLGSIDIPGSNKATMCSCQKQALLNADLASSGVPRKYLDSNWNWEGLNNNKESTEKMKEYANNFDEHYYSGQGIYLYGQQGRGKSLLESLVAREVAAKINRDTSKNYKIAFIIFEELVQLTHQSRSDLKARNLYHSLISKPDLLIVDNIGSETGSKEYNTKVLEFLLRKRDNDGVPTVISSNYTPEQLLAAYSDTVHDFIVQNSIQVLVQGENHRKKNAMGDIDDDILLMEDEL